ncbi:MAG TPA: hypothetical protein DEA50_05065 [Parvularcula sp.]|nr:hypothetical protein [Parvularcula sp.]
MSGFSRRIAPHEAAGGGAEPTLPSNRSFGLVVGAAFLALALLVAQKDGGPGLVPLTFGATGAALAALALAAPSLLASPKRLWMKLGLVLGLVMTPIVMGVVYVTTILPIGLIMRARGHDPLRRRRKPAGESYWIAKDPPGPDPATMVNQF